MTKRKNSCVKGKVGEREGAAYLKSLGFASARRTKQYTGSAGDSDIVCDELPHVFIECKRDERCDVGTAFLTETVLKAVKQSGASASIAILWRRNNQKVWKLTFMATDDQDDQYAVTVAGDNAIRAALKAINRNCERAKA